MSKRTMTRIVAGLVAAATLAFGATAPVAQAAPDSKGKPTKVQHKDTGWD